MRRIPNPSIPQTAALVVAAVVGTLIGVKIAAKRKWKQTKAKKRFSCHPYKYDEALVRKTIEQRIAEGLKDPSLIASEVAAQLFGMYPEGGTVDFPPGPEDPDAAQCVWALVVDLVDSIFKANNIELSQDEGIVWKVRDRHDPGYPWTEPSLEVNNVPTPGMFVDFNDTEGSWNPDEGYDSLVRTALASGLVMAGKDPRLASGSSTTSKRLRREMRNLFHCSQWDDLAYGQTDPNKAAGPGEVPQTWMLNSKGRGFNWDVAHADNLQRIAEGKPALRLTSLDGAAPLVDSGLFGMLLWVPAVDLNALKSGVPSVKPLEWADGSSTTEPPPNIQALGVDMQGVELPEGTGC